MSYLSACKERDKSGFKNLYDLKLIDLRTGDYKTIMKDSIQGEIYFDRFDQLHRLDGPAFIRDSVVRFFIRGVEYSELEFYIAADKILNTCIRT